MKEELRKNVVKTINMLYKNGGESPFGYVLGRYVNRDYWMETIKSLFPNRHVESITDFNYGTCFSYLINLSDTDAPFASNASDEYIRKNSALYRLHIQISALAPYALFKYVKHQLNDEGSVGWRESTTPYREEHRAIGNQVKTLLETHGHTLLPDDVLSLLIPDVSLEMKESDVTVYHCLFEDGYF